MEVAELKQRARTLVAKGRLEKAEVLYRQLLTRVPRDASVWLRHAETLKRLGRGHVAAWSYRTAANVLLSLGYDARALACLRLALELEPENIDLISEIIRVEMHRNRRRLPSSARPLPERSVPLAALEQPQLALPMLTEVDPRASADSVIVAGDSLAPPEPGPPPPAPVTAQAGPPRSRAWPQVRRLTEREVAVQAAPQGRWVVVSAQGPLEVRFVPDLAIDEAAPWL